MRAKELLARAAVEQLDAAAHRLGKVTRVDRARIGLIDGDQLAGLVARPDWKRQRLDQRAQRFGFLHLLVEARRELGKLALDPAHVLQAQDGSAADDMAIRFDRSAVAG